MKILAPVLHIYVSNIKPKKRRGFPPCARRAAVGGRRAPGRGPRRSALALGGDFGRNGRAPPAGARGRRSRTIAALENIGETTGLEALGLEPRGLRARAKGGDEWPLFPPLEAHASGMLDVGGPHRIYWEQSGNPKGLPVVFIHGGPGAGTAPAYRRFFDPARYRIILFDQRGAGRSLPEAELADNTTADLVGDIDVLRRHLRVERWVVFGGSWGSTLALAYGQAYPEHCIAFVLRGIFLFTDDEVAWFIGGAAGEAPPGGSPDGLVPGGRGMGRFFPEAHRAFQAFIPADERDGLLAAYYKRLTDPDPLVHRPAAAAWCAYENACSRLIPAAGRGGESDQYYAGALAMARIEAHYMMNHGFLAPDQLIANMHRLARHPAVIVQGRYDMVCPIAAADRLARAWPGAQYRIVADAGHSSMEPGIRAALVKATEDFKHLR